MNVFMQGWLKQLQCTRSGSTVLKGLRDLGTGLLEHEVESPDQALGDLRCRPLFVSGALLCSGPGGLLCFHCEVAAIGLTQSLSGFFTTSYRTA